MVETSIPRAHNQTFEEIKSSSFGLTPSSFADFLSAKLPTISNEQINDILQIAFNLLPITLENKHISHLPFQLVALRDEINTSKYLLQFEDNWDGEGSEKYSSKTWVKAVSFICNYANRVFYDYGQTIPIPAIYHGPKESIDLYWKNESFNLLVNFPKEDSELASFYGDDHSTQKVEGYFNPEKFQTLLFPFASSQQKSIPA